MSLRASLLICLVISWTGFFLVQAQNSPQRVLNLSDGNLRLETVYEDDFSKDTGDWLAEGGIKTRIEKGRLFFDVREGKPPAGTVWCKRPFTGDSVIEYTARIEEGAGSTNINFFAFGSERDGSSVLDTRAKRTGDYGDYHKINNYIFTYLNNNKKDDGTPGLRIRFRKDPGFHLLAEEWRKPLQKGRDYRFVIVVQGERMRFYVDGQRIFDHRDRKDAHRRGHHAFRTYKSHVSADVFRVSRIVDSTIRDRK